MPSARLSSFSPLFLVAGGGTAEAIAAFDWSATQLGPIAQWPQSLKTAVSLVVRSPLAMTLMWGREGTLLYNDAYAVIAGARHPGALGSDPRQSWPEIALVTDQVIKAVLAGESLVLRDQERMVERDGRREPAWFTIDCSPVLDEADAPAGVLAVMVETTGRITSERAAEASEARNRQILDSAVDYAIIAFDFDGKVTRWNEGARHVLGWSEAEMLGNDAERIFTPEDIAGGRMETEMRRAIASGVGNDERWHVRKSGERFWAAGEMTPIHDDAGQVSGFVKVLRDRTEQHRAAEALAESEARLKRAQEVGGVGTFTVDVASDVLVGTPEFCRIFGLPESEHIAATVLEALVIPEDAGIRSATATRGSRSAALEVAYRIRRASDGALRWIERKAEYETDGAGRVVRMVGVVRDITEQKLAHAAAEESAAQFRTFAQALPNHVWTAPPDGLIDWVNDRVYEYSGARQGELDGLGWARIVHPDDLEAASGRWSTALASGDNYDTEFRIRRADGAFRWHLVRAIALRNAEGAIRRWVGTNTDIHERKLAEAQSTRERDRIWTLSQELMLVCDFSGGIIAINPSATRLLGWSEDEMVGRPLAEFVHPDDLAGTLAEVAKLTQGVTTLAFENRYRVKDGSFRLLNWTAVPDGDNIHGVARDVTRERAAEDALRQAQKMEAVGQLTGGVAHDFNNLLTIIKTSIDLLRRPNLPEERRQRFMGSISNAVTRAAKLTGQLLAFARRQALQPVVFDAAQNVRSISDMIGTLVGQRIAIEVRSPDTACIVNADPSQFDTAVVNMAVNARDAMNGAGQLTIAVRRLAAIPAQRLHPAVPGDCVAISLADTGSGIAPDQLQRIFEPFYTTKGVGLGTGLGLSQVFGFAKQSGGDIHVDSTLGEGTTFTLYLPRAVQADMAEEAPADVNELQDGEGACILVVEDNPDVAASVDTLLRELGYTTVMARSAAAALFELGLDAKRFAVVFSDVVMAGMDGIALAYEIRRRHDGLPVVLSSGYSDVLARDDAHGFVLLPKPYSLDALTQVLQSATGSRPGGATVRRAEAIGTSTDPLLAEVLNAEQRRLAELESLKVLDTEEELAYDDLTRLAATFCDAPIALISLVDRDRQWFKSRVGLQVTETPREDAFCAHAIQAPDSVMVVNDATRDRRFFQNPFVTGDPGIRFYAGAPLVTSSGHALGTICVIGHEPRSIDPKQVEMLQFLANQVVQRLEARRAALVDPAASGPSART